MLAGVTISVFISGRYLIAMQRGKIIKMVKHIYKYEGINVTFFFFFFHLCMNHFTDFCKWKLSFGWKREGEKPFGNQIHFPFFLLWRRLFQLCGALIGEQDGEFVKTQHQHTDKHRDAVRLQMWQSTLFPSHVQTQTCCIKKDGKSSDMIHFKNALEVPTQQTRWNNT